VIQTKRVYEKPTKKDGFRVLVDRLWPRGMTKEKARVDLWMKEIAPSDRLRKWFHQEHGNWREFEKKYRAELGKKKDLVNQLRKLLDEQGTVTLLYGSKDEKRNQAIILLEMLKGKNES
jgi:uncharacterized protein YeaO (DUF488 family)